MRRVLLVIEDYNELLFAEKILKKVGFDIETLHGESKLLDKMIEFLPELVVATGNGVRVEGLSVEKKVKKKGGVQAKLLLIFNPQKSSKPIDYSKYNADHIIESPVSPHTLIESICKLTGLAPEPVISKFDKLVTPEEREELKIVSSKEHAPTAQGSSRSAQYAKFLANVPSSKDEIFDHQAVENERRYQKQHPDTPRELAIDEAKKSFVKELYKGWKR